MKRTSMHLTDEQLERLNHHSQRTGAPIAEIVRRAIDAELDRQDKEEAQLKPE